MRIREKSCTHHDSRAICISKYERVNVAFEGIFHSLVGVEQAVIGGSQKLRDIDVHSTIIFPVIGSGNM